MCSLHSAANSSSSSYDAYELKWTNQKCKSDFDCPGYVKCYAKCDYSGCASKTLAESYAAQSNYNYHDSLNRRLCKYNSTCGLQETGYSNCGTCPAKDSGERYCYENSRRRLSFLERHAVTLYDTSLDSINKHVRFVSESMTKHARLLSESKQTEAEKDYELMKKYAKEGCDAGQGFYVACYGGFFFGLFSLIFSSINACNCCKDCLGGFQGQYKCYGIYSIISSVWQLICIAFLGVLLSSVSLMNNMFLKWCKDSGTSCETSSGFMVVKAIEIALGVCMALAVFVFLSRLISGIYALIASGELHSTQKQPTEIHMQNVTVQNVQPVAVVVKNPQQQYV
eukprot:g2692.t1